MANTIQRDSYVHSYEKKLIEALNNLKGSITIVLIAHKLTLLTNADSIISLDRLE